MNIQNILVPTDHSEDAQAAIEAAIEFSKVFSAKLNLIHAYHIEIPAVYGGFGGESIYPAKARAGWPLRGPRSTWPNTSATPSLSSTCRLPAALPSRTSPLARCHS